MSAPNRIIVVSGFPRSGTSLAMQMISAAGVRCRGRWPAFEHDECSVANATVSADFVAASKGGAIKLLDPQIIALPTGFLYDFVWMRRNRDEQAKSLMKFLTAVGMPVQDTKGNRAKLANSMREDEPRATQSLRAHSGHRWQPVRFEDLIDRPDATVAMLAEFLGLPAAPMRARIVARSARCLEGMIELEQLESRP